MCDSRCLEGVGANYEPSHNARRDLLKTQHCQRVPSGSRLGHGQAEGVSFPHPGPPIGAVGVRMVKGVIFSTRGLRGGGTRQTMGRTVRR